MAIYNPEIYNEKEFISKLPEIAKVVDESIKNLGIDKSKYYFSQCLGTSRVISIDYGNIENEDVTLEISINPSNYQLENIELSQD